jgi:hypothetical protein
MMTQEDRREQPERLTQRAKGKRARAKDTSIREVEYDRLAAAEPIYYTDEYIFAARQIITLLIEHHSEGYTMHPEPWSSFVRHVAEYVSELLDRARQELDCVTELMGSSPATDNTVRKETGKRTDMRDAGGARHD